MPAVAFHSVRLFGLPLPDSPLVDARIALSQWERGRNAAPLDPMPGTAPGVIRSARTSVSWAR
jgi:hypothetical protein